MLFTRARTYTRCASVAIDRSVDVRLGKEAEPEVHDKACPDEEHALRYRWHSERMIRVDRIGDYRARRRNVRETCIVVERERDREQPLNGIPEVQSCSFIPFSRDTPLPDIARNV